jgi:hypothetical protein
MTQFRWIPWFLANVRDLTDFNNRLNWEQDTQARLRVPVIPRCFKGAKLRLCYQRDVSGRTLSIRKD